MLGLALSFETPKPTQPAPLRDLRIMRRLGLSYWEGGYANQPYIYTLETNAAIDAEIEHNNRKVINAMIRAKAGGG